MNYGVKAPYQPNYPAQAASAMQPWGNYGTAVGVDPPEPTFVEKTKAQLQNRYGGIPLYAWLGGAAALGTIGYLYSSGTFDGKRKKKR